MYINPNKDLTNIATNKSSQLTPGFRKYTIHTYIYTKVPLIQNKMSLVSRNKRISRHELINVIARLNGCKRSVLFLCLYLEKG